MVNGRKIAIIGGSRGENSGIPYNKKDWELWSLNNLYLSLPTKKFHRWFELHKFEKKRFSRKYIRRGKETYGQSKVIHYMKDLANLNIPIYMQERWKFIPKSEVFPFEEIMQEFNTSYFGCSFTWMTALALYEHIHGKKVDTISYWGINLAGVEYYYQKPSLEFFIGMAKGMGIKVIISEDSTLLKHDWIYAYKENHDTIQKLFVDYHILPTWLTVCLQQIYDRE